MKYVNAPVMKKDAMALVPDVTSVIRIALKALIFPKNCIA